MAGLDPRESFDLRRGAQEQGIQLARDVDDAEEAMAVLELLQEPRDECVSGLQRGSEAHVVVDEVSHERQGHPRREWPRNLEEATQVRPGIPGTRTLCDQGSENC